MANIDGPIRSFTLKQAATWACIAFSVFALADAMFVAGRASVADQYSFPAEIFSIFGGCLLAILLGKAWVLRGQVALGGCVIALAVIAEALIWLGMHG